MEYWLSLFDGMSCLQIAAKELGISPDKYYASEIDQHAIKQTQLNFPDTIQLGSVTEWKTWDIDWSKVSLIGAGSPCQGFSFVGKQLAFDDPRSVLFFVFIDILNHCRKFNPNVKFLLENVDMKREHMNVINNYCGLFAVNINSNRVSAQNRNRWYWSNIRTKQVGLFGETHTDIPQPKDRGILLKDILEKEVPEKYYLSDKVFSRISGSDFFNDTRDIEGKSKCITVKEWAQRNEANYIKVDKQLKPKPDQLKASCFTAGGNSGGNHSDMDLICAAMRGRNPDNPSDRRTGSPTERRLEPNLSGKTNCLTSVQKDNLVLLGTLSGGKWDNTHESNKRVYGEEGKMCTLQTMGGGNQHPKTMQHSRIRRLTPTECARLQTIPDWYKWGCSDTQQYRMLGNGWTVQVIAHILSFLK